MSLEDPFFVVKEEVTRSLTKLRNLYDKYNNSKQQGVVFSNNELERTSQELKNTVKSLDWDLEDLEDTIAVVEKNPGKFRLSNEEVIGRRYFIQQTKDEVSDIKNKLQNIRAKETEKNFRSPLLERVTSTMARPSTTNSAGYTRIPLDADYGDDDSGSHRLIQQQSALMQQQDNQLVLISGSVGTLKSMSRQIGDELDNQAIMLDDLGHEMENAQSKMDSTMKKMAKVLRLSNDRRQWMAIGILSGVLVLVIILFFAI